MNTKLKKIIYFDRETINNALQRENSGFVEKIRTRNSSTSFEGDASVESRISTSLGVPFLGRLKFLFNGKLELRYLHEWDSRTTVTSTDIGLFRTLEKSLTFFPKVQLYDVKNSLTSFRIAATFLKVVKQNNQELNVREASDLLTSMEGYDLYDIRDNRYVRFNQNAYLSNYKRNDISMSVLDLYCIKVGNYNQEDFDFLQKLNRMQSMFDVSGTHNRTLGDLYFDERQSGKTTVQASTCSSRTSREIALYDVLCAYVSEQ